MESLYVCPPDHRGREYLLEALVTGRMAVRIKESVERFLVVGPLRLERVVPGAFMWRPAPRAKGNANGGAAGSV